MRIALVHTIYSKKFASGIVTYLEALKKYFASRLELTTLLGAPLKRFDNIRLERIKLFLVITTIFELKNLINKFKPDIIHSQGVQYPASRDILFLPKKFKFIITQHGIAAGRKTLGCLFAKIYLETLGRLIFRRADAIIVTCKYTQKIITPYINNPRKLHLIRIGIDANKFCPLENPDNLYKKWGVKKYPTIITSSRLAANKNVSLLVRAIKHSQARLFIIGDGWEKNYLQSLAKALSVENKIFFWGYRAHEEIRELYAMSDIFILPSLHESTSYSLLEAMSSALPCIVSAVGGITEFIKHNHNGFLIDPNISAKNLGEFIDQHLADPDLCQTIGQNARQTILTDFTIERMLKQTEEVYQSLVSNKT